MFGIPVTVNVTVKDVLLFAEVLERDDFVEFKEFASKFLESIEKASKQLSEDIYAVKGANPYCVEEL